MTGPRMSLLCVPLALAMLVPLAPGRGRSADGLRSIPSFRRSAQSCPTPRPARWAGVRDSLWPVIEHRDGDDRWAHLDSSALPGPSATWCNPLLPDASAREAGHSLYAQFCANCHGDQGRGDGPGAQVADPPAYDFTRPEFAGMREPPGPAVLYAIVTRGISGTTMRAHADVLSGWERLAVLAYVMEMPGRAAVQSSRAWADSLRSRKQGAGRQ